MKTMEHELGLSEQVDWVGVFMNRRTAEHTALYQGCFPFGDTQIGERPATFMHVHRISSSVNFQMASQESDEARPPRVPLCWTTPR